MLSKRNDDTSSKVNHNKGFNNLSKLSEMKIKPWKWNGEEWIIDTKEIFIDEVSNDKK